MIASKTRFFFRPPVLRLGRRFAEERPENGDKADQKHRLKLTPELEKQFEKSLFGRMPKFLKEENLFEGLKNMFIFRDFLVPNRKNGQAINGMLWKSYFYLVASRASALLMPISLKYGVDKVLLKSDFNQAVAALCVYCGASVVSTWLDNARAMKSGKITQIVWYKMSARAFRKLMDSDW